MLCWRSGNSSSSSSVNGPVLAAARHQLMQAVQSLLLMACKVQQASVCGLPLQQVHSFAQAAHVLYIAVLTAAGLVPDTVPVGIEGVTVCQLLGRHFYCVGTQLQQCLQGSPAGA